MASDPARRPYRSTRRAEQAARTRADIVAAAARLFADEGWAGTTMTKVAAEAGVAVETVYQRFKNKAALLRAAVDATVGGPDGSGEPLQDQDRFARLGQGDRDERLASAAALVADVNDRTHGLYEAWRQAAGTDATIAAELQDAEARRHRDIAAGLALVGGDPDDDRAVDAAWAVLGTDVYSKLVDARGWSQADYEAFARHVLGTLLIRRRDWTPNRRQRPEDQGDDR